MILSLKTSVGCRFHHMGLNIGNNIDMVVSPLNDSQARCPVSLISNIEDDVYLPLG